MQEGNGFDRVILRLRTSKETCKELQAFMHERAAAEEACARTVLKLCKIKRLEEETGTLRAAYEHMLKDAADSANERLAYAASLRATGDKLIVYKDTQKQMRKTNDHSREKLDKELLRAHENLDKAKKAYLRVAAARRDEQLALNTMLQGNMPAKDVTSMRRKLEKSEKELSQAEPQYDERLREYHTAQAVWESGMSELFRDMTAVQTQSLMFIKETLLQLLALEQAQPALVAQRLAVLETELHAIDPEGDIVSWSRDNGTGSQRPPREPRYVFQPETGQILVEHSDGAGRRGTIIDIRRASQVLGSSADDAASAPGTPTTPAPRDSFASPRPPAKPPAKPLSAGGAGASAAPMIDLAIAEYAYEALYPNELTLAAGDRIVVLHRDDNGWWDGRCRGREGKLPGNYVREATLAERESFAAEQSPARPAPAPKGPPRLAAPMPAKPPKATAAGAAAAPAAPSAQADVVTACYDYAAQFEGELSFAEGDCIVVLRRDAAGWWEGSAHGVTGMFPANYCSAAEDGGR